MTRNVFFPLGAGALSHRKLGLQGGDLPDNAVGGLAGIRQVNLQRGLQSETACDFVCKYKYLCPGNGSISHSQARRFSAGMTGKHQMGRQHSMKELREGLES